MSLLDALTRQIADGLQNQSLTNPLRWAGHRRIMTGDFAGNYSSIHHPWVRGMHNSKASVNYAMKGAQLGVTEVLINLAFYYLDQVHKDVLYVLPTSKNASDFSKSRFSSALKNSPYLDSIFTDLNSVELKQVGSNTLYIRGSRSEANLISIPVSVLLIDEVDRMSEKAINLARERLSGSLFKLIWGISTPTVPNFGIHLLMADSTKERFTFKCPCCSKWTELIWPDCIEIIGEAVNDIRCHESYLKCLECGGKLPHKEKPLWLGKAEWHPSNHGGNPDIRGFEISQLYSFTVTPGDLVVAHFKGFGSEEANVEFHNSKIGIPYVGDGARVSDDDIEHCIANHSKDDRRPEVGGNRLITMGVDQGKWSFVEVTEWFFDKATNDLNESATAKVLFQCKFYEDNWGLLNELMREWQILACVIDADPQILEARRFAKKFPTYAWLTRFRRGVSSKEMSFQDGGDGVPLVTVDRTFWFSAALGRFREPRRILLPRDIAREYRTHIKEPIRTYVKTSDGNMKAEYVSTAADHFALARVYSEIALPLAASVSSGEDVTNFL